MSNYSDKLGTFRDKLLDMIHIYYPDYKIGSYLNGLGRIPWLSVDEYNGLRIAEVIAVESFGPEDGMGATLLVIDYVNSNSTTFKNIDLALDDIKNILTTASKKKKSCEVKTADEKQVEDMIHLESLSADKITAGSIDPSKFYLVTGRHNGKTLFMQNLIKNLFGSKIKDVIFNDPATIVFWEDGSKTVVQCQNGEEFDPEKGLAMAISKKVYGNDYNYYEVFKKWIGKYKKKKFQKALDEAMKIIPDEITRNGHRYVLADHIVEAKPKDENPRETSFNDYLNEQLKDPEFKKQFENTEILKPYCDTSKEDNNK